MSRGNSESLIANKSKRECQFSIKREKRVIRTTKVKIFYCKMRELRDRTPNVYNNKNNVGCGIKKSTKNAFIYKTLHCRAFSRYMGVSYYRTILFRQFLSALKVAFHYYKLL